MGRKGARKANKALGAEGRRERALKAAATVRARKAEAARPAPVEATKRPLRVAVLEAIRWLAIPGTTADILGIVKANNHRRGITDPVETRHINNALSSLRTAGHVISEPHPTSKRERLWRLA